MLTKWEVLAADGMTVEKVSAIERLLGEYSLRLGMSDTELEVYLNQYYRENPEEKDFYDLCDRICGINPNTNSANHSETTVEEVSSFDEEKFRQAIDRQLHGNPTDGMRLDDLGWLRYQTVREAFFCQPFYIKWFCPRQTRIKRAIRDAFYLHEAFCVLVTESCIASERWYFENREIKPSL